MLWEKRERTKQHVATEIQGLLTQVPGVRASINQGNGLGIRGGGSGLQFGVVGDNYATLSVAANTIKAEPERPHMG